MKELRLKKAALPSNFCKVLIGTGFIIPYFIYKELEIQGR